MSVVEPIMRRASKVIGSEVKNQNGESVGKIEDVMLDFDSGRIGYVVLSFGGTLGFGDKLFAVPWASLSYDEQGKNFTMLAHIDRLKNAPGFDKNNWPEMPNGTWVRDVYLHYEQEPYWTVTP
jgi:sporulation protein YlmC with PRC-barrel domain